MTSIETRNVERDSLFLMADVAVEGASAPLRVKVRNLSAGGMMGECEASPTRGARLIVTLRNIGPVPGVVAWTESKRFGVAFDEEIDPKLARTQVFGGDREAPVYARAAVAAPKYDGWNGKMRRI